ncbi:MAG: hypothetical protein AB1668_01505 [Nanoarchaeota archaeon]
MVLCFQKDLLQALEHIDFTAYHEFVVHPLERRRTIDSDEIIERYGAVKWEIVDMLNQEYSTILENNFDLYNWLNENSNDELAYFLNEAGSNVLGYSDFGAPYKFHLWLGKKGFILGIEQKGKGFNAEEVCNKKIKENEGAAFNFFRNCRSEIFFDDSKNARTVFMLFKI